MNIGRIFKTKNYRNLFILTAVIWFVCIFLIVYFLDLVPIEFLNSRNQVTEVSDTQETFSEPIANNHIRPLHIEIPSVGINTNVNHPESQNVSILDESLLSGAVYYPGSGNVEEGNIFVFGHSTGLPVVHNQAFKTFNNLKNVKEGDEIYVTGEDGEVYIYKALSVELVKNQGAMITFNTNERMITLSTCNTFGAKEDRHIVKAVFDRKF